MRETTEAAQGGAGLTWTRDALGDFDRASALEWWETDGLGGWASGTVSGAQTRKYHGLLVAATKPPVGRRLLVSKLAETLIGRDGARAELDANQFPGAVYPRGFSLLERFDRDLFPRFEFRWGGVSLTKTVVALNGETTRILVYELGRDARDPVVLELRPFFAGRGIHELMAGGSDRVWVPGGEAPSSWLFTAPGDPAVAIGVPGGIFAPAPDWWRRFEYRMERARGYDFREDLFTPGVLRVTLEPGQPLAVVVTTHDGARDGLELVEQERRRRETLAAPAAADSIERRLRLAADQFLVRRGEGRTVIAGYPWFADWGRDAMIALPGLCLATGRLEEAVAVLRTFVAALDQGLLPNRFRGDGGAPEYNAADATLWLFVAVWRYLEAGGDARLVLSELLPKLDEVLAWHERGTRFGIHVDADGLLVQGASGVQLTWMDARVGDQVVTPRRGKAVEIEALWYNALRIAAALHARAGGKGRARELERQALGVRGRFLDLFVEPGRPSLADVVDGEARDLSRRPNQLLALSLPFSLLDQMRGRAVLRDVEATLLTPAGLRSLAPGEPGYRPRYEGPAEVRDAAYHQGTVWPWWLGAWVDAVDRYRGAADRRRALRAVAGLVKRNLREAAVGSLSEIFDAEPPHAPRGAVAQAWTVAEILRVWRMGAEELEPAARSRERIRSHRPPREEGEAG